MKENCFFWKMKELQGIQNKGRNMNLCSTFYCTILNLCLGDVWAMSLKGDMNKNVKPFSHSRGLSPDKCPMTLSVPQILFILVITLNVFNLCVKSNITILKLFVILNNVSTCHKFTYLYHNLLKMLLSVKMINTHCINLFVSVSVAISQRNHTAYYDFIGKEKDDIMTDIQEFFSKNIHLSFPSENCESNIHKPK